MRRPKKTFVRRKSKRDYKPRKLKKVPIEGPRTGLSFKTQGGVFVIKKASRDYAKRKSLYVGSDAYTRINAGIGRKLTISLTQSQTSVDVY